MDHNEQSEWMTRHIPHRVRAAIARLPMKQSLLRVTATIDPVISTDDDKIYWRCSTDSIWEGRLAATRWLIEFVGIQDKGGNPVACPKKKGKPDVRITDFDGGVLLDPSTPDARRLADVSVISDALGVLSAVLDQTGFDIWRDQVRARGLW